jgi:ribose transport system permease protein
MTVTETKKKKSQLKGSSSQRLFAFIALLAIYGVFAVFGNRFFTYNTFINILDQSYYIGFLAVGVTFVIITGGIDLSLGTVAMCSAMFGLIAFKAGVPFVLSLLIIALAGITFGLLNGVLVSYLKLPAFIATMGTMMIALGTSAIISNVQTQHFPSRADPVNGWFKSVFQNFEVITGPNPADKFRVPSGAFWLIGTIILAIIVLNKTRVGRYTFAIGSNEEAVRLSGVEVRKWKIIPYAISGLGSGLAGIMYGATFTTIYPQSGQGLELDAIAAVVIGGTSLSGGVGSILGTVIGVFIMSVLQVGLLSLGVQPHYQKVLTGVVVIVAVFIDIQQHSRRET